MRSTHRFTGGQLADWSLSEVNEGGERAGEVEREEKKVMKEGGANECGGRGPEVRSEGPRGQAYTLSTPTTLKVSQEWLERKRKNGRIFWRVGNPCYVTELPVACASI